MNFAMGDKLLFDILKLVLYSYNSVINSVNSLINTIITAIITAKASTDGIADGFFTLFLKSSSHL